MARHQQPASSARRLEVGGARSAVVELEAAHQRALAVSPKGVGLDPNVLDHLAGTGAGATVLEAFAIELLLKARLLKAGIKPEKSSTRSFLDYSHSRKETRRSKSSLRCGTFR
jgi:hypothetical protein